MIRKAIRGHAQNNPRLEALLPHIKGNVGFLFSSQDLKTIRDEITNNKLSAPARVGSLAPCDVFLPAGNTSLDPSQTNFMQALNIATRINKGTIEIINQVHLIKKGDKVGSSEAALLQKLDIRPFSYGLQPIQVFKEGSVFSPSILDISEGDIIAKFMFGVQRVASLSLQINVPTAAAIPHYFASAYKSILAISLATDYTFERAEKLKALLNDPEALARATAQAVSSTTTTTTTTSSAPAPSTETHKEVKAPVVEEEEGDDAGFGDLFG